MFTHLHLHTEFSLLDGLSRIPQLMDRIKELGQEAVALTDHGALYGAIDFYKEAKARGIKPIIGVEAYVATGSRFARDVRSDRNIYHLTLLAKNEKGYRNLLALVTRANLEGYYYKPRMDRELFEQYHEGLIALSGCPSSELHRALQEDRWDEARAIARWYKEVFGDYYIEIQHHPGEPPEFTATTPKLVRLARQLDLPLVLTNDSHYTYPEDADIHDILLCIGTNTTVLDEKRMKMEGGSYYVKSEQEMRALFPELPDACDNTWRIAEQCDLQIDFSRLRLPQPDIPSGYTPDEWLAKLAWEGLARRYPGASNDSPPANRLRYELDVVRQTGFANYILVVRDFARFARERNIPMGVRGSAAGSIILYCLGITEIDPLAHRLVFERFLNPERKEMPDIDMDFADDRRDEVIRYAAEKYGYDHVAQIITFGTMGAKAAIRDVGRALGMSYATVDRVARLVPNALHMTIDRAMAESQALRQLYELDPAVQKLVDTAKRLEGVARHAGTHAAGVVMSSDPLIEHVPLQRPVRGDEGALAMTQYHMWHVAEIGLLKMDFLGLANLTILARAVDLVRQTRGIDLDYNAIPDGDPKTYEMLAKGETFAVFQLESAGMRRHIQELRPQNISELAAMVALYRPGPMQHIPRFCRAKHGLEAIEYPHPDLADILDETYGVITYQDQVLHIFQKFAGYSLGQADIVRKAMGKKIPALMKAERDRFIAGAVARGYTAEDAAAVFDLIEPFAGYAFNKAHSVCYATIAYQTAYLKANYPAEYMTAVLMLAPSHPGGTQERIAAAVAECAKLDIPVLAPDVNRSQVNFAIEPLNDGRLGIRFGLAMIKNVGHAAAEAVVEAREQGGPFMSIEDFCRRVSLKNLNKRALESMIKAGALDSLGSRGTLLHNLDRIIALAQREQKLREAGQATMFDLFGQAVPTPLPGLDLQEIEVPRAECLAWEKELLGVYVSEHPFTSAAKQLAGIVTAVCAEVTAEMSGRDLMLAGMVAQVRVLATRDGRPFCAAILEDLSGSIEVTVWPDLYKQTEDLWVQGEILLCQVRVRERDDRLTISVNRVARYVASEGRFTLEGYDAALWAQEPYRNGRNGNGYGNGNGRKPPARLPEVEPVSVALEASYDALEEERAVEAAAAEAVHLSGQEAVSDVLLSQSASKMTAGPPLPEDRPGAAPDKAQQSGPKAVAAREQTVPARPKARRPPARPPRRLLRIELWETADQESDRERLMGILNALPDYPGKDPIRLLIHTTGGEEVEMELPSAGLCDALIKHIERALGRAGRYRVEPIQGGKAEQIAP